MAHPSHRIERRAARSLAARALAPLALLLALWPAVTPAAKKTFSSGSLIIPASVEYQTDTGVLSTYGLVYIALWKNADRVAQGLKPVTFYWAVQPNKLSQYRCNTMTTTLPAYGALSDNDGCDFYVDRAVGSAVGSGGQPVALLSAANAEVAPFNVNDLQYAAGAGPTRKGSTHAIGPATNVVKYLGGAWIVDATDRQAFLGMLQSIPELAPFHRDAASANFVNIHSARANFTAPVVSVLTQKPPRIALIGSNQTDFLINVLENAALCGPTTIVNCGGTFAAGGFTAGVVYDYYPDAGDLLNVVAGTFPDGRLNGTVNGETYGILWAGDGVAPTDAQMPQIAYFADQKGTVFAEYDSPYNFENSATHFMTTTGMNDYTPNIATFEDCNDQNLPVGSFFRGNGASCLVYGGANQPYAQTGNFLFDGGQGSFKGYTPKEAFVIGVTQVLQVGGGPTIAAAWNYGNSPSKGLVLYLAGHKFDNGRLWGERVILNTVFSRLNPLTGLELARSEPVGYRATMRVYQGTYVQLPLPDSNDVKTYNPAAAQIWSFPYTAGHLYEYDVGRIATASQAFGANRNWDAAARMPLPGRRDLFTVVGGSANLGWKKIPFDYTETAAGCHDYDGDSKCDLSALFAACNAAGVTTASLEDKAVNGPQAQKLGLLVQQARGYCSAHAPAITGTPIMQPTDAQCDCAQGGVSCGDAPQTNRAVLGGIDHGSPAVVGPSRYVVDAPWSTRPVVSYAAGHDGMLHAFYVSGSTAWAAEGRSLPAGVAAGQELWAFVPPGQVCGIAFNDALVDGSINVVDVFGDFPRDANNDGVIDWTSAAERPNHVRRWRTVLIASAGLGGSELFALDVTNPLKPVLLWHLAGSTERDGRWDANANGVFGAGETFLPSDASTFALKWFDWDDGLAGTTHIPTNYNVTAGTAAGAAVIEAIKQGRYDYRNMGLTYSAPVAKIWTGASYQYVIFAATSAADHTSGSPTGFRGVEVFAIDVITGQKLWQWEHLYASSDAAGIDNSIPPAVALGDIDANGSTKRIYVADMEGRLWELSSKDGRNRNYLRTGDGTHRSFPFYGTPVMTGAGADAATRDLYQVAGGGLGQQPLTTPIGEGRFTAVPPASAGFDPTMLLGKLALVVGTMGVDWAIAPFEAGHIFVLPSYPETNTRLQEPIDLSAARDPLRFGVVKPQAIWDIPLATGERVYGMPRVANNTIVFNTAFGSFTGDISGSYLESGNLKIVTSTATDTRANESKSFGGALILGGNVVITTDHRIRVLANPPASVAGGGAAQSTFNRVTPAIMKSWEPR